MAMQIGIIGPEDRNIVLGKDPRAAAGEIGRELAQRGVIIFTGGCSGVAEAAARAAQKEGGITVGTPGRKRGSALPSTTVEVCTPIEVGDFVFAGTLSCDAIIVFPGDAGTLAELAIAFRYGKPLVFVKGFGEGLLQELFNVPAGYPWAVADSPKDAALLALQFASG